MTDEHIVVVEPRVPAPRAVLHPLVAQIQASGSQLDATTLRDLLAIQREWEAGEARREYAAAFVRLRPELATVAHDREVAFKSTHYTYATLGAILESVTGVLASHGFALHHVPATPEPSVVTVTARLTHERGHVEECTLSSRPSTKDGMLHAQAVEATITTLRRATTCALLGIATSEQTPEEAAREDDDAVDEARNRRAVAAIVKAGRSLAEAEELVGAPNGEWTAAHLDQLRAWLRAEPRREREPGEEG